VPNIKIRKLLTYVCRVWTEAFQTKMKNYHEYHNHNKQINVYFLIMRVIQKIIIF